MYKIHLSFCIALIVLLGGAIFLIPPTVDTYRQEKHDAESYWQVSCLITNCFASSPIKDTVEFQSLERFNYTNTLVTKNGCLTYPTGSTVKCYVNLHHVTLLEPGGSHGIRLVIANSVFAILSIILIIAWVILCLAKKKPSRATILQIPGAVAVPLTSDDGGGGGGGNCPE
jgi:hypothetical protein